ncbi:hypothetical protein VTK73DRAFT_452 [Phialemonium thermophilum]|uniref:Phosphatidic acid phosphatase type 2/haloperoxidase domain-containing protein n=1 Tax=Phialemonium thermophilum TaxID=223376 RepID=A0ABR3VV82_9PEZI
MGKIVLVASYVADWAVLVAAAVVGYVLGNLSPHKRPFSIEDRDISFPHPAKETISISTLILVSVAAPAIIIVLVCLAFVPGATVPAGVPRSFVWRRKLWELHATLLGLAFSVASAWFVTSAMKNLLGKPRPDLLARCQPDMANVAAYVVGGTAPQSADGQLVSARICQSTDTSTLNDGFRSFPSGHSSTSASGLVYLSLVLASKFGAAFPFWLPAVRRACDYSAFPSRLNPKSNTSTLLPGGDTRQEAIELERRQFDGPVARNAQETTSARRQAAAPPVYLFAIAVAPFLAAVYISSTRWFDFQHHGFDILFGFFIGTVTSLLAFRYYHMPLAAGAGWAWGPRSEDDAWWAGLGCRGYAATRDGYLRHRGDEEAGAP